MAPLEPVLSSSNGIHEEQTVAEQPKEDPAPATYPRQQHPKSTAELLSGCRRMVICDLEGALLRSSSTFPYFMLVAFEAGGLARALLLLLLYPLLCCVDQEVGLRVMTVVCFCGIKVEGFRVGRAVLPKHLLEGVGLEGFEMMTRSGGKKVVCVTGMPRVMVEASLKEYLGVDVVVGRELRVAGGYYTGLMEEKVVVEDMLLDLSGEKAVGVVGIGGSKTLPRHPVFSLCMDLYVVSDVEKRNWHPLAREKYSRPLVFHDGRLAFRPTPLATLVMFLWLPLAIPLCLFRVLIINFLPYRFSTPILAMTGIKWHVKGALPLQQHPSKKGRLFVCNHRTLADPVYISIALNKQVTAVTYSVSRLSEFLSVIPTARLRKNLEEDRNLMEELLGKEDLVVCPEGTTCREPYLLRFSPLFTELCDDVLPVAIDVHVGMFYATTAGGSKYLDLIYFLMNPWTSYQLEFLEKIHTRSVREGRCNRIEMANYVQGKIARALGFECTSLTRRHKYLMLAGNEGFVKPH